MAGRDVLARVPLFAGLEPPELDELGAHLRSRRYGRAEYIFQAGDPGSGLYLIEAGRLKIALTSPDGKEIIIALLGADDFFGDLALLDGEPRSADAVTLEPCRLWFLDREEFGRFLDGRPAVARKLLAVLSRRLRRNAQLIQDAAFLEVPDRLARVLLQLAEQEGRHEGSSIVIASRLTQSDLAGMVGATRESVNKWLRDFERQGLIHTERGAIRVLDLARLRERVREFGP